MLAADDSVPSIGLTMRENWLPTQLQANFIELIQRRVEGSLLPLKSLRRLAEPPAAHTPTTREKFLADGSK